jgi:hypothetical protein
MKKLTLAGVALMVMLPMMGAARGSVGVFGGPAIGYGPGYGYYPEYYAWSPMAAIPNAGEVRLDTKVRDAEVFINGSLAGTSGHLKTMYMRAGAYDVQIREPGRAPFEQKIYVVAGKVIKLHPDAAAATPRT